MRFSFLSLMVALSFGVNIAQAKEPAPDKNHEFMAAYLAACPGDKIYASCRDQSKLLNDGLREAKAQGKLAVVVFGFNDCPPCNVLDAWLKSPRGTELASPFLHIDLSIFDPARNVRPEVFSAILPALHLSINQTPPYGVPLFAIVDPTTRTVWGQGLLGFSAADPSKHIAYLSTYTRS